MRILIDLQGAQCISRFRGIGRYSLSLAVAMARDSSNHEIWLALNSSFPDSIMTIRDAFEGLIEPDRIRIFKVPTSTQESVLSNSWRRCAAEIIRESFLLQIQPDVVYISSLFEGYKDDAVVSVGAYAPELCTAVTLYDLIPLLDQEHYLVGEAERKFYFRKMQSLENASLLLSISEASRIEALDALQLPPSRLINVSAAAENVFSPLKLTGERIQELREKYAIGRNLLTYIPGGFDYRKNFRNLIRAYSMLSWTLRAHYQLVILGNVDKEHYDNLRVLAAEEGLGKEELILTGYVPDNELIEFYNLTTLFVFPSTHEGFGLPVLEAMACGAPVIGSNIASISEVIGFDEALFDPYVPQDIANKITQSLSDELFREKLRAHGLKQAASFSWSQCGKRVIKALEELVQSQGDVSPHSVRRDSISEVTQLITQINTTSKPSDLDIAHIADCIAFNTGRSESRQLLLDISVIIHGDAKSGIQRVVRSLLRELVEVPLQDTDVRPIYFDGVRYKYVDSFFSPFTIQEIQDLAVETVGFCQDDIYLALDLNAHLTAAVHDVHMDLQLSGIKMYFIVYDLLLVQHPEWWPDGTSVIFEGWLHSISAVSTGLICISESVATELREWLKLNSSQRPSGPIVTSFHLGADVENSLPSKGIPNTSQAVLAAIKATPSFLMVGTIEPRKGHAQTLGAFELLWEKDVDVNLVIVGANGWLVDELIDKLNHHPELNKRIFWLEGISDEYLQMIYASSICLMASSEGEGFGLPLIEAVQHKLPIIARDIPVFREVAGHHAFYFSGLEATDLVIAITKWLKLHTNHENPTSDGMHYLSWKDSAKQLKEKINGIDNAQLA